VAANALDPPRSLPLWAEKEPTTSKAVAAKDLDLVEIATEETTMRAMVGLLETM
jgi:hypothetical protein